MSMTELLFYDDARLGSCEARVIEAGEGGIVLDRTVFYPLGGGQPGDAGTLSTAEGREIAIVDTRISVVKVENKGTHNRRVTVAFAPE